MADKNYNEAGFFQKLNIFARIAGHILVEKALQLYYAAESKDTPKWAKGVVMGALAYFVSPIDAIPDVIPGHRLHRRFRRADWCSCHHRRAHHAKAKSRLDYTQSTWGLTLPRCFFLWEKPLCMTTPTNTLSRAFGTR